jgi:hypothetical protein
MSDMTTKKKKQKGRSQTASTTEKQKSMSNKNKPLKPTLQVDTPPGGGGNQPDAPDMPEGGQPPPTEPPTTPLPVPPYWQQPEHPLPPGWSSDMTAAEFWAGQKPVLDRLAELDGVLMVINQEQTFLHNWLLTTGPADMAPEAEPS